MQLAVFTKGKHSPKCSGCPACSETLARRYLAMMSATPERAAAGTVPPPPSLKAAIEKRRTR